MPETVQTLEEFVHRLTAKGLERAASALLHGRPLPEQEAKESLLREFVGYPSIQRRVEMLPVQEVTTLFRQAVAAGGYLPWTSARTGLSTSAETVREVLEQYFLGTVGVPDWRPIGLVDTTAHLIVFPEIAISWLRNAPPQRPRLFSLESDADEFMAAVEKVMADTRGGQTLYDAEEGRQTLEKRGQESLARHKTGLHDQEQFAKHLFAVVCGERLMERLAQVERRPFHHWNALSDRERCLRTFTHVLTFEEDASATPVRRPFARRVVQTVRGLEAGRWYAPDTVYHLTLLEILREEAASRPPEPPGQHGEAETGPESGFGALVEEMRRAFGPVLRHCGILEHAVVHGAIVAERLTRDGLSALSHRLDWQHWEKLKRALPDRRGAHRANLPTTEGRSEEDTACLSMQPGQPWEDRLVRFFRDLKRFLVALVSLPLGSTRKGRPVRSQLHKLMKLLGWQEDYAEVLFDFARSAGLVAASEALARYVPTGYAAEFLDGDAPERGRDFAAFFWQEGLDQGPISEDMRELKRVFVQEFLGRAGNGEFARLAAFWDWLADTPSQQRVIGKWKRYVGDEDDVLLSIAISMARTLTWLGMAQASPDVAQPEFLRLSPLGRSWLVHCRFDDPIDLDSRNDAKAEFDQDDSFRLSLDLPLPVLAEFAVFTVPVSLADEPCFRFDEEQLRAAVRSGEDPARFLGLLRNVAGEVPAGLLKSVERIRREAGKLEMQPASGYLRIDDAEMRERILADEDMKRLVLAQAGKYVILRVGADARGVQERLHRSGYLVRGLRDALGEENVLSQIRSTWPVTSGNPIGPAMPKKEDNG
jgi:hypothetical protein